MLHAFPDLDLEDTAVLAEIAAMRAELAEHLRVPRQWTGRLRRTALARAIRGSNSIEGYRVELDDADASLDGEEPLSADQRTFAEIRGYRQALGYVLTMTRDEHFRVDVSAIRSMHFMMLSHDLAKSPGQYRQTDIYVHDDRTEQIVYTGPDATEVPVLMGELVSDVNDHGDQDPVVQAAMAHLNLVMIHPFRDGNGRMARALQTMVLAQKGIAEPEFSSIEEWLGSNTEDYYRVLAATGRGHWNPDADAHLWVSFNLRAHHLQAQTVRSRWHRAQRTYVLLDEVVAQHGLPERVDARLLDVRRPAQPEAEQSRIQRVDDALGESVLGHDLVEQHVRPLGAVPPAPHGLGLKVVRSQVERDPQMRVGVGVPVPASGRREHPVVVLGVAAQPFLDAGELGFGDSLLGQNHGLERARHPAVAVSERVDHRQVQVRHRRLDYWVLVSVVIQVAHELAHEDGHLGRVRTGVDDLLGAVVVHIDVCLPVLARALRQIVREHHEVHAPNG